MSILYLVMKEENVMEKKRGFYVLGVLALLVSVIAVSVSYAALNTTLIINGTAKVAGSSWKIKYANLSAPTLTGKAEVVTAPTINTNDTTISTYDVKFTAPGDSVKYTFDVVNDGTFDAEVTSFVMPTPTCTGQGANATVDAANVCNNLVYTLTYSDGTAITVGDELKKKTDVGNTKGLVLTLTYKDTVTAELLPVEDVTISGLTVKRS